MTQFNGYPEHGYDPHGQALGGYDHAPDDDDDEYDDVIVLPDGREVAVTEDMQLVQGRDGQVYVRSGGPAMTPTSLPPQFGHDTQAPGQPRTDSSFYMVVHKPHAHSPHVELRAGGPEDVLRQWMPVTLSAPSTPVYGGLPMGGQPAYGGENLMGEEYSQAAGYSGEAPDQYVDRRPPNFEKHSPAVDSRGAGATAAGFAQGAGAAARVAANGARAAAEKIKVWHENDGMQQPWARFAAGLAIIYGAAVAPYWTYNHFVSHRHVNAFDIRNQFHDVEELPPVKIIRTITGH